MQLFYAVLTLLLEVISFGLAADTNAWKPRSIYFALTDRIARNGSDVGGSACSNLGNYCGGTFKGLEAKLGYIKGMGFDAIWITPVVTNRAGGYHGYWAQDIYAINPNLGTADDLKNLVNTAHSMGIYVMVDVVANHMGGATISANSPSPLNQASSYHTPCQIDYSNQTSIENCMIVDLPDLFTQHSDIRSMFQAWIKWLVTEYGFDGLRIDTVKHVEKDYWPGFVSAAGVYAIGEVFSGDPNYLSGYASVMPGLLNYALYYPMNNFFQQKGSSQALVDMHNTISSLFPDPAALGTFLDNHDNPRWLNAKNDITLFKNALTYVALSRGIPIIYYGTEQAYSGGSDPANREDLWRSNFNANSELYVLLSNLMGAKKAVGGLTGNDQVHLYVASNAYAFSRANGNLVVLTTNAGSGNNQQHCFNAQKSNGAWKNALSGDSYTSDGSGNICVTISNGGPVVLVAGAASGTTTTLSTATSTTATATTGTTCPTAVSVTFTEQITTVLGDTIKIAGSTSQLGAWNTDNAPALSASQYTSSNPVWSITLDLPASQTFQYKFIKVSSSGSVTWESDPNRSYTVPSCQSSASVSSQWR